MEVTSHTDVCASPVLGTAGQEGYLPGQHSEYIVMRTKGGGSEVMIS